MITKLSILTSHFALRVWWLVAIVSLALVLTACENKVAKTAVSITTNAYYTAFQDATDGEWLTRLNSHNNNLYRSLTISFTVPDKQSPYAVAFVCPSVSGTKPHEVFAFFGTPSELDVLDFNCKRAQEDILMRPIYGSISDLHVTTTFERNGEQALISLGDGITIKGWEAYAKMARAGIRDVIAYKGRQVVGLPITPEKFYIRREAAVGLTDEFAEVNISFSEDIAAYTASFNAEDTSSVNISGVSTGEVVTSRVGFLSDNKSFLPLAESNQLNFSFLPVPLETYTGALAGFVNHNEFNPGEGHELVAEIRDVNDQLVRKVQKIFTHSNSVTHNLVVPQAIAATPVVGFKTQGNIQQPILNWTVFNDTDPAKQTKLYRWELTSNGADPLPEHDVQINPQQVHWIVHVTPGWLAKAANSTQNFSVQLPADFKVARTIKNSKGEDVSAWRQEWSMEATAEVNWEYVAITVSNDFTAKDVVDYFLNRNFDVLIENNGEYTPNDFTFAESYARAIAKP